MIKALDRLFQLWYNIKRCKKNVCGSLAQLGEHMPYKHRVTGSIPVAPTIFIIGPVVQFG